jgi:cell division FtsZ-interacting protein ZapD
MESLFSAGRNTLKPFAQAIMLVANFIRQAIAKFLEEISDVGMFHDPIGRLNAQ